MAQKEKTMPHRFTGHVVRATTVEKMEIGLKVKTEMLKDERGYWKYKPGWNDEAVALYVNNTLHPNGERQIGKQHVVGVRREVCGIMKLATTHGKHERREPQDRLAKLEQRMRQMWEVVRTIQKTTVPHQAAAE